MPRGRRPRAVHSAESKGVARSEETFACSSCPERFRRREHATRHERIHTGEKRLGPPCLFCDATCSSDNQTNHIKALHQPSKLKSCEPCETCDFTWVNRRDTIQSHARLCAGRPESTGWIRDSRLGILVREGVSVSKYEKHVELAEKAGWKPRSYAAPECGPLCSDSPRASQPSLASTAVPLLVGSSSVGPLPPLSWTPQSPDEPLPPASANDNSNSFDDGLNRMTFESHEPSLRGMTSDPYRYVLGIGATGEDCFSFDH